MADRPVVWAPRAKHDIDEIWARYARLAAPETADRLVRDIAERAEQLGQRPLLGRPRNELVLGLRSALISPYIIFYRVTDAGVEIVRVLHERRNIPDLLKKPGS